MSSQSPVSNLEMSSERVAAFFRVREDAFRTISELKEAGFTSHDIGLVTKTDGISASESVTSAPDETPAADDRVGHDEFNPEHSESMWEKLKHFFSGDSADGDSADEVDYHESTSGMNWDPHRGEHYFRGIAQGGALVTVTGPRTEEAREILQDAGGDLREEGFEVGSTDGTGPRTGVFADADADFDMDDEELAKQDIDEESTGRLLDSRVQLHGEVLRNYRERTGSRETPFVIDERKANRSSENLSDNLSGGADSKVIDPDGDLDLEDRSKNFKNPAA